MEQRRRREHRTLNERSILKPEGTSLDRKVEHPVHGWNAHHTGWFLIVETGWEFPGPGSGEDNGGVEPHPETLRGGWEEGDEGGRNCHLPQVAPRLLIA